MFAENESGFFFFLHFFLLLLGVGYVKLRAIVPSVIAVFCFQNISTSLQHILIVPPLFCTETGKENTLSLLFLLSEFLPSCPFFTSLHFTRFEDQKGS